MSFISWESMKVIIDGGRLIVDGKGKYQGKKDFSASGASIDLALGNRVFVTPSKVPRELEKNQIINIHPGQFAALNTEEILDIPEKYIGFITIRFTYKSKGLVNISGFHVDPGFYGRSVFSVYNAGPTTVTLRRGKKIFSLFLANIEKGAKYEGGYANMKDIPISIIEPLAGAKVPSLQVLETKVNRNDTLLTIYGTILVGLVLSLLGALISGVIRFGGG